MLATVYALSLSRRRGTCFCWHPLAGFLSFRRFARGALTPLSPRLFDLSQLDQARPRDYEFFALALHVVEAQEAEGGLRVITTPSWVSSVTVPTLARSYSASRFKASVAIGLRTR